ncbi:MULTISPECIES: hypothetical protein [unclassified Mesorhizobium]|uniref:hypothetical protein n=1 Tax=unclassified Mesorhizobium TaxID=325217 RepID=UPI001FE13658|nr:MULTISPECIES: hypothetical protein [unclassified Mesorhizobium]
MAPFIVGAFSHADIQQPAISRGPAPFLWVVIIVLIVGAGLFFAPVLVKPRCPWAVTPSMPASSAASTPPKWS